MTNTASQQATRWGGPWTKQKLDILERYLDSYTTVLKWKTFSLIYIDAFAGTGSVSIRTRDPDYAEMVAGSPKRALNVSDKAFDRLVFVDKSRTACHQLEELKAHNPHRHISIVHEDANSYLKSLTLGPFWRGVLFIDPFATELEWFTLVSIANLERLDTWILFPTMAVQRVLKRTYKKGQYPQQLAATLNRVFGGDSWRNIYSESRQLNLFSHSPTEMIRRIGTEDMLSLYREKLRGLFGNRLLAKSRSLKNSQSRDLFELFFCVGHPNGIERAKPIARHILENF